MSKEMLYTQEGYDALVSELDELKTIERPKVKEALAVARSYGDLSENSEYDEAKNRQAQVEARISELEDLIIHAKVVSVEDAPNNVVNVGSVVTVTDVDTKEKFEYSIVGSNQADPMNGFISDQSPIGAALIGAHVRSTVKVQTPGGEITFKVNKITK